MHFTKTLAVLFGAALCEAQFSSPRGGDVLQINKEIQIQWRTQGLQAPININLVPSDVTDLTVIAEQIAVQIDNVGKLAWTPGNTITAFKSFSMIITDSRQVTIISQSFQISQLTAQPVLQTINKPVVQNIVATRPNGELVTSVLTTFGPAVITAPAGPIKLVYSGRETPQAFIQTPVGVPGAGVGQASALPTASAAGQVGSQLQPLPGFNPNGPPQSLVPLPGLQTGPVGELVPLPGLAGTQLTPVAGGQAAIQTGRPPVAAPGQDLQTIIAPNNQTVAIGSSQLTAIRTPAPVVGGQILPPTPIAVASPTASFGGIPVAAPVPGVAAGSGLGIRPLPSAAAGGVAAVSPLPAANGPNRFSNGTASSPVGAGAVVPGVAGSTGTAGSSQLQPLPGASGSGGQQGNLQPLPGSAGSNGEQGTSQPLPGSGGSSTGEQSNLQPLPGSGSSNGGTNSLQPLPGSNSQATGTASLRPLGGAGATGGAVASGLAGPSNGGLSAQTTSPASDVSAGYRISSRGGLPVVAGLLTTALVVLAF